MIYDKFSYLFPPRPDNAIPAKTINFYANRGYVAQYKKNGTCNILFVSPNKKITCMTRHNTDHKLWEPTTKSSVPFVNLPGNGWYVFVTEVLHSKFKGVLDTHYIFDMLVNNSDYLVNRTFMERNDIMNTLFTSTSTTPSHAVISKHVWLANIIASDSIADSMKHISEHATPENEGLVLKNPNAKLKICSSKNANNNWMVKCRVPHKNYSF